MQCSIESPNEAAFAGATRTKQYYVSMIRNPLCINILTTNLSLLKLQHLIVKDALSNVIHLFPNHVLY